jgi:hypothetical protein
MFDHGGDNRLAQQRKSQRTRTRLIAVCASVGAHLAVLVFLVLSVRGHGPEAEAPPLLVTLTPWFTPRERPAKVTPRPIAPHRTPPPVTPVPPSPIPAPLPAPKALTPNSPIDSRVAAEDAVRGALQDSVRCAHPDQFNMTGAEREHCRQFFAHLGKGGPTYDVNVDDHARHDPPVASHGTALVNHLSPRPGYLLGSPPNGDHAWNQNPDERRGP